MNVYVFSSEDCAPCQILKQEDVFLDNRDEITLVNAKEHTGFANKYNVRGLPALRILDDDKNVVESAQGSAVKDELKEYFQ